MVPVFLLSLPRSGSTLLQRILATAPEVATAAEPWLMLPLVYARRPRGARAEYEHNLGARALNEFLGRIPDGARAYESLSADLARALYSKAAGPEHRYFVDKTPRYYLIVDELFRMFPDGRFIILWRNPLAVVASMIQTWGHGRWCLHHYRRDLYVGPLALIEALERYRDRVHGVRYERLVVEPAAEIESLCRYLGLPYRPQMVTGFTRTDVEGSMGDKAGIARHRTIDAGSLDSWPEAFCNILRVMWARRYLRWLGDQRLRAMGYDRRDLLHALRWRAAPKRVLGDLSRMAFGPMRAAMGSRSWR